MGMGGLIGVLEFLGEVFGSVLQDGDFVAGEGGDEVGAGEVGDFGGFALGELAEFVPFDGGGDAHFVDEIVGGFAEGGEGGIGELDLDGLHGEGGGEDVTQF
jgi:hypothetical protein